MAAGEIVIPIVAVSDIVTARQEGRMLAAAIGFSSSEQILIATAISEAARNILQYAGKGEIVLNQIQEGKTDGILIVARDEGPGIPDIQRAMQDGFSTSGGLGLGLPGIKRLMSEMNIVSTPEKGTTVVLKKWKI
jgi:serine/threonine-protein kinase RsbT